MIAGPVVVLAMVGWLAGHGGRSDSTGAADAVTVLLTSGPWALGWLLAAIGLGWPLRRRLLPDHPDALAIQVGLGVAAMITLDAAFGAVGVLQWGGAGGAWALIVVGIALLIEQLRRSTRRAPVLPIVVWTAVPAVAVLVVAACSAPGWLWSSEFGGYDAMSYHLQLPAEWQRLGQITPLEHNVYSWLPGYVEAAYYHIAVLMGDGLAAVYACQLLHALFAGLTAALVGRFAWRLVGQDTGRWVPGMAVVLFLGTPWVIVTGSLAYNEMVVTLLLVTGLLIVGDGQLKAPTAVALGIVIGAACGAKLTAVGFVAAPLAVLLLIGSPAKRLPRLGVATAGAALVCLLPWLIRNGVDAGNPVFPFATGLFGLAHWTAEQADAWTQGHAAGTGIAGRAAATWTELLGYGLGENPAPPEPWLPQWSLLWWLAPLGLAISATSACLRRWATRLGLILLVQLVFWLIFTHLKSRFMLPAVVPAALAVALGIAAVSERLRPGRVRTALGAVMIAAALLWCCLPGSIYLREAGGIPAARIDFALMLSGDALSPAQRQSMSDRVAAIGLNYDLPDDARVLAVGDATPLYYRADVTYQTTWDRGPLSAAMRSNPDDPSAWLADLSEQGFTHLLVAPTMLAIWERSGWNDPLITVTRVMDMADRFADLQQEFQGGERLYHF
jgi:hypothetical protein